MNKQVAIPLRKNRAAAAQAEPVGSSDAFSGNHARAGLQWFIRASDEQWKIPIADQLELLGGISRRTFHDWKRKVLNGETIELGRDTMERLSLLLGIYKALKIIAPVDRPELAYEWFVNVNDNPLFMGRSPKDYIIHRKLMDGLYTVRRYYDAARG